MTFCKDVSLQPYLYKLQAVSVNFNSVTLKVSGGEMPAPSERSGTGELESGKGREWLGHSVWQASKTEISRIKSWPSITAMSYLRDGGEATWRGDRSRLVLIPEGLPPVLMQVEQGRTWQTPLTGRGTVAFYPAGLTVRVVQPAAARFIQALWDTDLYSTLVPELGAAASRFELLCPLHDPLLSQILTIESLGTALCIRIARHFVGDLQLPTSGGLSSERLQRVRDYIEAHLDEDVSLTVLADIACLSPYHFSRSFKRATGLGPQRYVIQRRVERAKRLLRQTHQPLALIAQEAGFADQSHLTQMFRREMGVTPGRFRAALV
jgi:AraC-like DNA-binding protein